MKIVYADEAMGSTLADEGEGVAVRSPYQSGDVASRAKQGFCFGSVRIQGRRPYLSVREKGCLVSPGRYDGVESFAQLARLSSRCCDKPDAPVDSIRQTRSITLASLLL